MASLKAYTYGLVLLLAIYWAHQGWKTLVAKGRHAAFRRDQRRKAGIPDSDNRPFSIAAAEAAQSRRRQEVTKTQPNARGQGQSSGRQNAQSFRKAPSSPFRSTSLLPTESTSFGATSSQSANHSGLHLRRSSPALSPSTAQRAAMLAPGQSSRYDPATYIPASRFSPKAQDTSLRPVAGSKRPAGRALSDAGSEASTLRPERRSAKHVREEIRDSSTRDSIEGSEMAWEASNGSSGHRDAGRGKKRGAEDVRDRGEEDSVFAGRGNGKKGRQYDGDDSMDEDDDDDRTAEEASEDEDENVPSPYGRSAGKRKQDEVSVGTGAESQDEEEDDVPRRRGAKLAPKSSKSRKIAAKKAPSERTLRDEMMMLDEDDVDAEDSLRSQKARVTGLASKRGGPGSVKEVPDDEREVGDEWVDPVNGLQWRMDEDEVLTEEEGSATGRKRRVKVRRRVKRRLTVKREMRKKWDMPSDSTHPDREELVPHYVPAWLSEAEFEDAKRRGELGFQVGEATPVSPSQASGGSRASPARSPRNVDLLFHQAPNPRPLFGSRLSSPARSSPAPMLRASASSSSLSGSLSKKPGGRISLAGASSASTDSPLRSRVLDTAGKRRREEELLRKLRESNQVQAPPRSAPPTSAGPTSGFGQPAADKAQPAVTFALPTGVSDDGKETHTQPSAQGAPASSPFSFGPPAPKASESKSSPAPFSFGAPKTAAPPPASGTSGTGANGAAPVSFGAPSTQAPAPPASSAEASKSSPAPFSFGAPPTNVPSSQSASTPFSFGAPKKEDGGSNTVAKPSGGFSFGTPSSGGGANAPAAAPAPSVPSFSFGAPSSTASGASKSSTPFSFGAPPSGAPASAPDSAQAPKPAFTFGGGGAGGSGAAGQAGGASSGGGFTFSFGKK
ncbi:hypothetical protein BCV69DRAFT_300724 [Microstroma glucosiphilum]|uniref:Uncharacterized protein n=1 Tax=Pseudomicrostroma glucosiphilum TaxID=1684307 RepID=A0A316U292_9BASI|nr:hypothetical protein BCV69DRAFT_300724 [Pseudomicrostroma glucosiphilum]PWN18934.1 hypothetical protein BCV69DRAFT_300724 [Pseudomicrostroma glucosiphilum]